MKVTLKIKSIPYGDIAIKLLPMLKEKVSVRNDSIGKLMTVAMQLPDNVIHSVFDAIPDEDMNEILMLLLAENKNKVMEAVQEALQKRDISVVVDDIAMTSDLSVYLSASQVDYTPMIRKFMPMLTSGSIIVDPAPVMPVGLAALLKLPAFLLVEAFNRMPQARKNEIIIYLVNWNKEWILKKLTEVLKEYDINIQLEDIVIEK